MDVRDFAAGVYSYCRVFSASCTSWVRSTDRNRAVGGVINSAHLVGLAADVVYDGSPPGPEGDEYLALRGLKRLPEGDHDHIMPADWRA
jgi:hypothetical protein